MSVKYLKTTIDILFWGWKLFLYIIYLVYVSKEDMQLYFCLITNLMSNVKKANGIKILKLSDDNLA